MKKIYVNDGVPPSMVQVYNPCLKRALNGLLRKYRTIRVVDWRGNFSSGVDADFAGLLEVSQEICIR